MKMKYTLSRDIVLIVLAQHDSRWGVTLHDLAREISLYVGEDNPEQFQSIKERLSQHLCRMRDRGVAKLMHGIAWAVAEGQEAVVKEAQAEWERKTVFATSSPLHDATGSQLEKLVGIVEGLVDRVDTIDVRMSQQQQQVQEFANGQMNLSMGVVRLASEINEAGEEIAQWANDIGLGLAAIARCEADSVDCILKLGRSIREAHTKMQQESEHGATKAPAPV